MASGEGFGYFGHTLDNLSMATSATVNRFTPPTAAFLVPFNTLGTYFMRLCDTLATHAYSLVHQILWFVISHDWKDL